MNSFPASHWTERFARRSFVPADQRLHHGTTWGLGCAHFSVQGDTGFKTVYVSWIGKDVFALPLQFDSKADLKTWTTGKALAKSKVAKGAGKVNTRW